MNQLNEWISSTSRTAKSVPSGVHAPDFELAYRLSFPFHVAALNYARVGREPQRAAYVDAKKCVLDALKFNGVLAAAGEATAFTRTKRQEGPGVACAITLAVDRWLFAWRKAAAEHKEAPKLTAESLLRICWLLGRICVSAQIEGDVLMARLAFLAMCLLHDHAPITGGPPRTNACLAYTAWSRAYGLKYLAITNVDESSFERAGTNAVVALTSLDVMACCDRLWAATQLVFAAGVRRRDELYLSYIQLMHYILECKEFTMSDVRELYTYTKQLLQKCGSESLEASNVHENDDTQNGKTDSNTTESAAVADEVKSDAPSAVVLLREPRLAEPEQSGFDTRHGTKFSRFDRVRLLDARDKKKRRLHDMDVSRLGAVAADDYPLWLLIQLSKAAQAIGNFSLYQRLRKQIDTLISTAEDGADRRICVAALNLIDAEARERESAQQP